MTTPSIRYTTEQMLHAAEVLECSEDDDGEFNQMSAAMLRQAASDMEHEVDVIEQIASQWDGCKYESVGEVIDIGKAIRDAGHRLLASQPAARLRREQIGLGYIPGELDRTAPEVIYLQVDTTGDNNDRSEPWTGEMDEHVSWCSESIGGLEIRYVRGDLMALPTPEQTVGDGAVVSTPVHAKFFYVVAADAVSEGGSQLYTIHDEPVPMADNWLLVDPAVATPANVTDRQIACVAACIAHGRYVSASTARSEAFLKTLRDAFHEASLTAQSHVRKDTRGVDGSSHLTPEPPLAGRWHHGNGYLACGGFRIAHEDWEAGVCAAPGMRTEVFEWICQRLNASPIAAAPEIHNG